MGIIRLCRLARAWHARSQLRRATPAPSQEVIEKIVTQVEVTREVVVTLPSPVELDAQYMPDSLHGTTRGKGYFYSKERGGFELHGACAAALRVLESRCCVYGKSPSSARLRFEGETEPQRGLSGWFGLLQQI